MKILVLGSYYSNNLGDGVICECVAQRLRHHFPDVEVRIMDLRAREQFLPAAQPPLKELRKRESRKKLREKATKLGWDKLYSSEQYRMNKEKEHFRKLSEQACDLVVFAGGQMFMDTYALQLEYVVNSCSKRGIPVIFNACGAGATISPQICQRLSKALADPCVKLISTRDDADRINRSYLRDGMRAKITFDPALWCNQVYGVTRRPDAQEIGLGMMYPNDMDFHAVSRFWTQLIMELELRKMPWKIFVNGSGSDVTYARYVFSLVPDLTKRFEDCFAPIPAQPRELVETISGFKSLISFRLHSHIIAASLGIPSVAMVWSNKLNFFFEKIGHPERCCHVKESPEAVLEKLERAEREGYSADLLEQQRQFADLLLRDTVIDTQKRMSL